MIYVTINIKKSLIKKKKINSKVWEIFLVSSSFAAVDGYIDNNIYLKWIANSVEK